MATARSKPLEAMILAAGRGERMRPLTDVLPKPLVPVCGAPLIEHHIRKLVAVGVRRIVINVSYLAAQLMAALGDGRRFGCELIYSIEPAPMESGGGIATASAHFHSDAIILVSADIYSEFDYATLLPRLPVIESGALQSHFVMVAATAGEPGGEFALDADGRVHLDPGAPRMTLANIAVLATAPCRAWPRGERFKLLPYYQQIVAAGAASGEAYRGVWKNVTTVADVESLSAALNPKM